jgi:hypothetical protein
MSGKAAKVVFDRNNVSHADQVDEGDHDGETHQPTPVYTASTKTPWETSGNAVEFSALSSRVASFFVTRVTVFASFFSPSTVRG